MDGIVFPPKSISYSRSQVKQMVSEGRSTRKTYKLGVWPWQPALFVNVQVHSGHVRRDASCSLLWQRAHGRLCLCRGPGHRPCFSTSGASALCSGDPRLRLVCSTGPWPHQSHALQGAAQPAPGPARGAAREGIVAFDGLGLPRSVLRLGRGRTQIKMNINTKDKGVRSWQRGANRQSEMAATSHVLRTLRMGNLPEGLLSSQSGWPHEVGPPPPPPLPPPSGQPLRCPCP